LIAIGVGYFGGGPSLGYYSGDKFKRKNKIVIPKKK
jgi:hypothetical protein